MSRPAARVQSAANQSPEVTLQQAVQDLNQSQHRNEGWARWLDSTVKVLHAFSETVGEGVTLV